jgi:hypothetical protein
VKEKLVVFKKSPGRTGLIPTESHVIDSVLASIYNQLIEALNAEENFVDYDGWVSVSRLSPTSVVAEVAFCRVVSVTVYTGKSGMLPRREKRTSVRKLEKQIPIGLV